MQYPLKLRRDQTARHDRGAALMLGLGVLAVAGLWGMLAWSTGTADVHTTDNYRQIAAYYAAGQQAFYAAEAGVEAARARLRSVPGDLSPVDPEPYNPDWQLRIGAPGAASAPRGLEMAYTPAASAFQTLTYAVTVRHAVHPIERAVLRWGDLRGEGVPGRNTSSGAPLYVITAQGHQGEAQRSVEIEAAPEAPLTVPAALYVAGPLQIQQQRASVRGLDSCGVQHQAGIRTPFPVPATVLRSGQEAEAQAVGEGKATIIGRPAVVYHSTQLQVQSMVEHFKPRADVVYAPSGLATSQAATSIHWGRPQPGPTFEAPSSCAERHIIAYTPQHGPAYLPHGSTGCGMLLVDGDLILQGDFSWYGAILVTGTVRLSGAGKTHITGGMLVAAGLHLEDGGETSLLYCSEAIAQQTRYLPLRVLSWREVAQASP